ncbi:MAG: APC family permease, partial [Trebonia sp.]
LQVSARVQLAFSATIAVMLLLALLISLPHFSSAHWIPFAPHGVAVIGRTAVVIFFAFFGWEAITHLAEEFRDPVRDVPRSTVISVGVITVLYLGVAIATIGTGTYGSDAVNRTAISRLLGTAIGGPAGDISAALALLIALGTANAFIAATSRLGFALARSGSFPAPLSRVNDSGIPQISVLAVGGYALVGLFVSYLAGWNAETLLVVPDSLVIMTYLAAMIAGIRLLRGARRVLALIATTECLILVPFSGVVLFIPVLIAVLAIGYRLTASRTAARRQRAEAAWPRARPRPAQQSAAGAGAGPGAGAGAGPGAGETGDT